MLYTDIGHAMFIYIYGLDHFSQARHRLDRSNLILLACATRRRSIGRAATECVALQETRNITRARTQIQNFIQEWILYLRGAFHAYIHLHTLVNAHRHEDATIMHMHVSIERCILRFCAANVFSNDKKRKRTTDFVNSFELILFNILHPFLISTDWSEQTWNYCNDSATYVVWMRLRMHPCTRVCVFVCTSSYYECVSVYMLNTFLIGKHVLFGLSNVSVRWEWVSERESGRKEGKE